MKQKHFHIREGLSSPDTNILVEPTTTWKIKNAVAKTNFLFGWTHNP